MIGGASYHERARLEWLRGAIGALMGIGLTALVCRMAIGSDPAVPWIVAPMGATTVLVFAVPASPFAQPWPVLGGHLISAAIGVSVHLAVPDPTLAIGIAVSLAIAAMSLLRCLHPPAGGTAVLMTISTPEITAAGWQFLLTPIALNVLLLLALALAWHRLTGHSYPHRPPPAPAAWPGGFAEEDLDAVLARQEEVLSIEREDLAALFRAVEQEALRRRSAAGNSK